MKKIFKAALTVAIVCVTAVCMAICVSAETQDIELPTSNSKLSNGGWSQSVSYEKNIFNFASVTSDSEVLIEFEVDGEWDYTASGTPVELILQNFDSDSWVKIPPCEVTETSAKFSYNDIVNVYGSDDFSTVDKINFYDRGVKAKVTKVVITNCNAKGPAVTTVSQTEAVTTISEAETTTMQETTKVETSTTNTSNSGNNGGIPIVLVVVITAVVAVAAVVAFITIKNKRRFY